MDDILLERSKKKVLEESKFIYKKLKLEGGHHNHGLSAAKSKSNSTSNTGIKGCGGEYFESISQE